MAFFSQSFIDQIFDWWYRYANPDPPTEPTMPPPPKPKPMFADLITDHFLAKVAANFKMTLSKAQGDAIRALAKECDLKGVADQRHFAYVLATCYNESRFKSIREIRAKKGSPIWELQENYWHTNYYGRGFSQLTWRGNYSKFGKLLGLDLLGNPDKVLEPAIGAKILVTGMAQGLFTGKKMSDFINAEKCDWFAIRSTVNGIKSEEGKKQAETVKWHGMRFNLIITEFTPDSEE